MSNDRVRYLVISQRETNQAEPEPVPQTLLGRMQMALDLRDLIAGRLRTYEHFRELDGYGPYLREQIDAMADRHDSVRPWFMPRARRAK